MCARKTRHHSVGRAKREQQNFAKAQTCLGLSRLELTCESWTAVWSLIEWKHQTSREDRWEKRTRRREQTLRKASPRRIRVSIDEVKTCKGRRVSLRAIFRSLDFVGRWYCSGTRPEAGDKEARDFLQTHFARKTAVEGLSISSLSSVGNEIVQVLYKINMCLCFRRGVLCARKSRPAKAAVICPVYAKGRIHCPVDAIVATIPCVGLRDAIDQTQR